MYNYWLERKRTKNLDLNNAINYWYSCFATDIADSNYFQVTTDEIQNYKLNFSELLALQDFYNSCLENVETWTETYIDIDHI